MSLSIKSLAYYKKDNKHCPNIFKVKAFSELQKLRKGAIKLRLDFEDVPEALTKRGVALVSEKELEKFGIRQDGIYLNILINSLSRGSQTLSLPSWFSLRMYDAKTVENAVRAIVGRICAESVFEAVNIFLVMRDEKYSHDTKVELAILYLKDTLNEALEDSRNIILNLAEKAYGTPTEQNHFIDDVCKRWDSVSSE